MAPSAMVPPTQLMLGLWDPSTIAAQSTCRWKGREGDGVRDGSVVRVGRVLV